MTSKIRLFDIAEHLGNDAYIREFLEEAAVAGNALDFIHALNIATRAKGMTEVAKRSGVSRASLYKSLSGEGNPRLETISKIVGALGCKLAVIGHGGGNGRIA